MPPHAAAQVDGQPELGAPRTESDGVFERRAPSETRRRAAPKRTSKSTGDRPVAAPRWHIAQKPIRLGVF